MITYLPLVVVSATLAMQVQAPDWAATITHEQQITLDPWAVTQFWYPVDSVVLLAHNYLFGGRFLWLVVGDEIEVMYQGGQQIRYQVVEVAQYEVVTPNDEYSDMIDSAGKVWSVTEIMSRYYMAGGLTLQTCTDGINGRLFVRAEVMDAPIN